MGALLLFWQHVVTVANLELFKLEGVTVTLWTVVQFLVLSLLLFHYVPKLNLQLVKKISKKVDLTRRGQRIVARAGRTVMMAIGFLVICHIVGIDNWIIRHLIALYKLVQETVDLKLFKLGHTQITLLSLVYLLTCSWLLVRVTAELNVFVVQRILGKTKLDHGLRQTTGSAVRYAVLFLGFIILLQTAGIDLSSVTIILGAFGIGISFGLQAIVNNFISGLIILFERPIKLGDRVQIGEVTGDVHSISLRATTVVTNDNIAILVPNSQFVTGSVVNWTYGSRKVGLKFPFSVPTSVEPRYVEKLIMEVLRANPGVLEDPAPALLLEEISAEETKFIIHIWTTEYFAYPEKLRSELNYAIAAKLREAGVELRVPASEPMSISTGAREGQEAETKPEPEEVEHEIRERHAA